MKPPPISAPDQLANELFRTALCQFDDVRVAAVRVMTFLAEALVYATNVSSAGKQAVRRDMLAHLGTLIAESPEHPAFASIASMMQKEAGS